jgi:hypothetical protein
MLAIAKLQGAASIVFTNERKRYWNGQVFSHLRSIM